MELLAGQNKGQPALIRTVRDGLDYVTTLASSHDGKVVAVGEIDGTIKVFDLELAGKPRILGRLTSTITSLSQSPDGKRLAASDVAGHATVIDIQTGNIQYRLEGVYARFAPDGQQLFTCGPSSVSYEAGLFVWDAATGTRLRNAVPGAPMVSR